MKHFFKRFISVFLVVTLASSLVITANAADSSKRFAKGKITQAQLKHCSVEELMELSHTVDTTENANAVFNELLLRLSIEKDQEPANSGLLKAPTTGNTTLIDNYISIVSASVTTSHVLTLVVNVKGDIPVTSYFNFKLGYEYPSACRTDGTMLNMSGRKKGTHTITINTKGLVSGIYVSADLIARDYKEHKHFKTLFDKPYSSKVTYKEITQADVTANQLTIATGGAILYLASNYATGGLSQAIIKVLSGLSVVAAFDTRTPSLAVGQYYKTTTTYTSDFKCKVNVQIYASKASYNTGASPIFTTNSTVTLPH